MNEINKEQFLTLKSNESKVNTVDFNGLSLEIKSYISETSKYQISKNICDIYFSNTSNIGMTSRDFKDALIISFVIQNYTNIDLGECDNHFEVCDIALESGLYDLILDYSQKDIDRLTNKINETIKIHYEDLSANRNWLIENKIDTLIETIEKNSFEVQLGKFLDEIITKIPDDKQIKSLLKTARKDFKNFDPNKLKFLNDTLKELGEKEINVDKAIETIDKVLENK